MERRLPPGAFLRGVRVFLVGMKDHAALGLMLRALGAEVRLFAALGEAEGCATPTGTTILVVCLAIADHEHDADPVTFVVEGFGVPGVLRVRPLKPSFNDRFVEVHRGHPGAPLLCASIVRAATLSRDGLLGQPRPAQGRPTGLRVAV